MTFLRTLIASMLLACVWAMPATSEPLADPNGPVILTISGAIEHTNDGDVAAFDLEMLRDLGESEIVTETIWTPGTHVFAGVRLKTLLDRVGATGETLNATAINDYTVTLPVSDATESGPIVAYAMDGTPMSRRDKGPLWIIYPFSSSSDYRTEVIYARSIWQLDRMTVEE